MTDQTEIVRQENREIAKTIGFGNEGFAIQNLAQATLVADTLISSQLVPTHFNSVGKIIVVAQAAKELGKPLWWGLNNMHVINGKVGYDAAAVAGLILESGVTCHWDVSYKGQFPDDNFTIVVTSQRKGHNSKVSSEWSIADAKTAGLWGKNTWKGYPKQMLTWRAITFHGRLYYSDVLGGAYTDMELADMEQPLPAPKCDIPARADRRKKVESQEAAGTDSKEEMEFPSVPVVSEASDSADGTAGIYLELREKYSALNRELSFTEYAADALCRDEEEVDSPGKFTLVMLQQLGRHLEAETDGEAS